ncbi:dynamin family protein [Modestobacter sp. URMC 112]
MTAAPTACESCGTTQEPASQFCSACGAYLGWAVATPAPRAPEPPPPPPVPVTAPPPPPAAPPPAPFPPAPPPAPPAPSASPAGAGPPERARDLVGDTLARVAATERLAREQSRPDLALRLRTARERLTGLTVPVVVVGEFKRGKSTLVNALLRRSVCPVDADVVTAVPTVVRHGDVGGATAVFEPDRDTAETDGLPPPPRTRELALEDVADAVSELGHRSGQERPVSVEVRLPHPLLRSGLALVDTPGVGGLDSAHGVLTLGALDRADGVLFVTDATQELTAPEMQFLRMVLQRCPDAACVITKTDLHASWRRIAELDEGHLARAGLRLPVMGVSSLLRLQPVQDAALTEESGFRPVVRFLAERVAAGTRRAVDAAAVDVRFVAAQLGRQVEAERQVVTRPAEGERVVEQLTTARARTERLAAPGAGWQQALSDRVQDLVADVDHELQDRMRTVTRAMEEVVDRGDPKDSWPDVEAWLRREVAAAVVATYDTMRTRAEDVVSEMASYFDAEAGAPVDLVQAVPTGHSEDVELGALGPLGPGGRLATTLVAVRSGTLLPMTLMAAAGHVPIALSSLAVLSVLGPISLALFGVVSWKVVRNERARQLTQRRQLAKAAARAYLEEVSFRVGKDCRDSLRHLQRRLRDEFQDRAAAMHRSSLATLAAAQGATGLDDVQRRDRARTLDRQSADLRRLQAELSVAAAAAPQRAARRG